MKQLICLGGLPGSGKSTVARKLFPGLPVLDLDHIREGLPLYQYLIEKGKLSAAEESHTQAQGIRDYIFEKMISDGESFVYDSTWLNPRGEIPRITRAQEAGYEIKMVFVSCDPVLAWERTIRRGQETGRFVPRTYFERLVQNMDEALEIWSSSLEMEVL